ncbi:hypothetical protein DDZ18_00320 [Marinicauda salina]|jgi:hypothetical protein|uniref:Uncharacterized protein n=1 Tax=Marinicauda salina TaxID=2135793 RepID=A0A2U2BVP5_9PROT|nr:hypothetical protein [Marinicauda salina]PWE18095.1 hypothetical protein DDZ18_00320 [Marinicauda salina]
MKPLAILALCSALGIAWAQSPSAWRTALAERLCPVEEVGPGVAQGFDLLARLLSTDSPDVRGV